MTTLFVCLNGTVINNVDYDWALRAEAAWEGYIVDENWNKISEKAKKEEKEQEAKEEKKKEIIKGFKKAKKK